MTIRLAGKKDAVDVDRYIKQSDHSNLYHDYRWGNVVQNSFGHKYYPLISRDGKGAINGILPMVHMKSFTFGNFIVSMPYFNYGGICTDDESTRDLLIEEAIGVARDLGADHIEFRQEFPIRNGFPMKTSKVSMRLSLPDDPEELWKSFPSKLRSQVKVPQKSGFVARMGKGEEMESFYHVFSINMRYLGTPVYPKTFFRNILEEFSSESRICTVYKGNIPIASGFLVGFKNKMEIPWASSIREYNRQSPNMLLYWSCLKFACEQGFSVFDFGRSTEGESTHRFKAQWGAIPSPMRWSYWLRDGVKVPDITPSNRKYQLAIELWKKMPLSLTKILGPRIVRNIP